MYLERLLVFIDVLEVDKIRKKKHFICFLLSFFHFKVLIDDPNSKKKKSVLFI